MRTPLSVPPCTYEYPIGWRALHYDNRNTEQRMAVHAAIAQSCPSAGCQLVGIGWNSTAGACMCCRAGAKHLKKLVLGGEARAESTEWRPQWGPDGGLPHPEHPRLVLILGLINMLFYVTAALRIKLIKHRT